MTWLQGNGSRKGWARVSIRTRHGVSEGDKVIDLALGVGEDVVAHLVRALLLDDGLQLGAAAHLVRGRVRVRVRVRARVRGRVRVRQTITRLSRCEG